MFLAVSKLPGCSHTVIFQVRMSEFGSTDLDVVKELSFGVRASIFQVCTWSEVTQELEQQLATLWGLVFCLFVVVLN